MRTAGPGKPVASSSVRRKPFARPIRTFRSGLEYRLGASGSRLAVLRRAWCARVDHVDHHSIVGLEHVIGLDSRAAVGACELPVHFRTNV
jgi:hypothetical protein